MGSVRSDECEYFVWSTNNFVHKSTYLACPYTQSHKLTMFMNKSKPLENLVNYIPNHGLWNQFVSER